MENLNFAQILPVTQSNINSQVQLFDNANLVSVRDGKCFCTSLMIAEKFEKEHNYVLRTIRDQMAVLPKGFCESNFGLTSVEVAQPNGGVRSIPIYELTRDGFSFIVMGFTGEKAAQWKIKFIEAFNAMEAQLRESMPNFNDPLEAAKAWIKAEEARREALALAKEKQLALKLAA